MSALSRPRAPARGGAGSRRLAAAARRRLALAAIAGATLAGGTAAAAEWSPPGAGFSLQLGDDQGWRAIDPQALPEGVAFEAHRERDAATLQVAVAPNAEDLNALEPSVEEGLRQAIAASGGELLGGKKLVHQGIPAVDFRFEQGPAGQRREIVARWIGVRGRSFQIALSHPAGATLDPPAATVFDGLRLLGDLQMAEDRSAETRSSLPALVRNAGIALLVAVLLTAGLRARRRARERKDP